MTRYKYILYFILFAFIGWIYEEILAIFYGWGLVNRGFLLGPYLPIYGFGAVILIVLLQPVMKKKISLGSINIAPLVVLVLIMLITTLLEYGAGFLLEQIFHQRWWDYSHYPYQLHGLICLSATIRFGLGGMFFLYILKPLFDSLFSYMTEKTIRNLSLLVILVISADFIITMIRLVSNR